MNAAKFGPPRISTTVTDQKRGLLQPCAKSQNRYHRLDTMFIELRIGTM